MELHKTQDSNTCTTLVNMLPNCHQATHFHVHVMKYITIMVADILQVVTFKSPLSSGTINLYVNRCEGLLINNIKHEITVTIIAPLTLQ